MKSSARLPQYWRAAGNPAAPCLLFLHGFMGSVQDWTLAFESLSQSYYCLGLDLPGHGQNPLSACSFAETWGQIQAVLQRLEISKFTLIGYSLGGRLALAILYQLVSDQGTNPNCLEALILESSGLGLTSPEERRRRILVDHERARRLETEDFEFFLEHWYSQPLFGQLKESAAYPDLIQRRLAQNPRALADVLRTSGAGLDPDYRQVLSAYPGPVLYLAGSEDQKYALLAQHLPQELNPKSSQLSCSILAGGHNLHAECPRLWALAVQLFLEKTFKLPRTLC